MDKRTEYAIIRFLEQGSSCYQVSDVVEGMTIIQCVKDQEEITGEMVFDIFQGILSQLQSLYKMQESVYGYVNPCTIVRALDGRIFLIDVLSKENIDLVKRMQKRSFREKFVSKEAMNRKEPERFDDLYGVGKVMQFLIDKANFSEGLSRLEQRQIQKLIKKCMEAKGKESEALMHVLDELKNRGKRHRYRFKNEVICAVVCGSVCLIVGGMAARTKDVDEPIVPIMEAKESKEDVEERVRLCLELALLSFSENQDYLQMRTMLEKISKDSVLGQIYLELLDYIQNSGNITSEQWTTYLEKAVKEWDALGVMKDVKYRLPILEACRMTNTTETWKLVKQLGGELADMEAWDNADDEEKVRTYLGEACIMLEEKDEALLHYERLKKIVTDIPRLERVYLKLLFLYGKLENPDEGKEKMLRLMEEASGKLPEVMEHTEFMKIKESFTPKENTVP